MAILYKDIMENVTLHASAHELEQGIPLDDIERPPDQPAEPVGMN